MPYYLLLKQPLKVKFQTKNGQAEKEFAIETLLPVLRVYEPKKPMHRKFPYDVFVPGIGMRRMGRNSEAYELVEVTENELPSDSVRDADPGVGGENLQPHETRDGDEAGAEGIQPISV